MKDIEFSKRLFLKSRFEFVLLDSISQIYREKIPSITKCDIRTQNELQFERTIEFEETKNISDSYSKFWFTLTRSICPIKALEAPRKVVNVVAIIKFFSGIKYVEIFF